MKRVGDCPLCQCEIWIPDVLFAEGMALNAPFFCAYGHKQVFSKQTVKNHQDAAWAKLNKTVIVPVTKNQNPNNVFPLFKAKGHETQPNP